MSKTVPSADKKTDKKTDKNPNNNAIGVSDSLALYVAAWPAEDKSGEADSPAPGKGAQPTLLCFAAPDYGIMFRCRVVCKSVDAVATAAMTGLRFVEVSLKRANIQQITVMTDSPAYYFQVTGQTKVERLSKDRREMMEAYRKKFKLAFKLIERTMNPARYNCHAMANTPADVDAPLKYNPLKWPQKGKMMPLQNGIEL